MIFARASWEMADKAVLPVLSHITNFLVVII
jgi:hypothetical protein